MREILIPVAGGFCLDLIIGDPHLLWHPVQGIGFLITWLERLARAVLPEGKRGELAGGAILVILTIICSGGIPWLLLYLAGQIHAGLKLFIAMIMCYQVLAVKSLKTESMKVYQALAQGEVEKARTAVSYIVGRDTKKLSEKGIIKAAVETVAENLSDGIIAPLCYLVLGGPVLGFMYKAVNTMDSMIGYKNERYLYFGRMAAVMDDICNYIPARISAIFMITAAFILRYDGKNAARIFIRDRKKHSSPNAGQTEAVAAGALGIELAGDAWYFGKVVKKDPIGDPNRAVVSEDIIRINKILYVSAGLALVSFLIIRGCIIMIG